jgi:hypothetical protein
MHRRRFVAFLGMAAGAGLGIALATGPTAAADPGTSPIDTWPYDSTAGDDVIGGSPVYGSPDLFDHGGAPPVPWYTADVTTSGDTTQTVVTKVLDPSFGYPSVGTVADQTLAFDVPEDNGGYLTFVPLYQNYSISDPNLGTGDTTEFLPFFVNSYVSDKAGIEDQVSFFGGQPVTLYDIPASGATTGAAAELGDPLQQLLTDLAGGAPSPADLF